MGEFGAVLVIGGGIKASTETGTLFIYRLLDERQYAGAYTEPYCSAYFHWRWCSALTGSSAEHVRIVHKGNVKSVLFASII